MLTKNLVIYSLTCSVLACGQRAILPVDEGQEPTVSRYYAGKLIFSRPDGESGEQLFQASWSGEEIAQITAFDSPEWVKGVGRSENGRSLTIATSKGPYSIGEKGAMTPIPMDNIGWQDPTDPRIRGLVMDGALLNSQDGKKIAFASTAFEYAYMTVLHILDASGGQPQIFTHEGDLVPYSDVKDPKAFVSPLYARSFVWADAGETLIAAQSDKLISVSTAGRELRIESVGYEFASTALAISPDGKYLALNRPNFDPDRGRDLYRLQMDKLLAGDLDNPEYKQPTRLTFDQDDKRDIAYGPNGLIAVTNGTDGQWRSLRIIDTKSGDTVATIDGVTKLFQ